MAKLTAKGMLGVAFALSLATSGLVYYYLQTISNSEEHETVPVIVAKVDIPSKTKVTGDMVSVRQVPAQYIQPGAIRDTKQVIGVMTSENIIAGEQITGRRMLYEKKAAGLPGVIPPGKRAISIAVTEVSGVAGLIKPGDYVDIMATFDQGTTGDFMGDVLLQNVQVLAVNRDLERNAADQSVKDKKDLAKNATVTLAVDAALVHHVAVAEDRGKIRLALRPFVADAGFTLTRPVSARELVGKQAKPDQPTGQDSAHNKPAEPAQPQQDGRAIQVIRGVKMETVAL